MRLDIYQSDKPRIRSKVTYEFHVLKSARIRYGFEQSLFSITGDLIINTPAQARALAQKINKVKEEAGEFDKRTTPGQVNTLGLLHEIFHYAIRYYEEQENPGVLSRMKKALTERIGKEKFDALCFTFIEEYPPLPVFKKEITAEEYLKRETKGTPNSVIILEEMLLLHLENFNPGFKNIKDLFDNTSLIKKTDYGKFLNESKRYFQQETPFSLENMPLLDAFEKLILASPTDIGAQIRYVEERWKKILPPKIMEKLLKGTDLIREDAKLFIPHGSHGTPPVPSFKGGKEALEKLRALWGDRNLTMDEVNLYYHEAEQYTADIDWMPNVIMIAKNAFVWLNQLSKRYKRDIYRLDQIPDEELNRLAYWNINTLWLIGVFERSTASKKIKQFCGNPEAAASAYSLFDYEISHELGGEEAYEKLRDRCFMRGIRLASDMVPNHTGIFSKWIMEHPDYYIQSDQPPFPGYSFAGPDLSENPNVQIRIEDKYYSREDAAVVFQHIDNSTGKVRYIYHGNDGTSMPWNDTAQLNLLLPDVREALIQMIMRVARKFPVIRFDAAMTLTKKHYQRLWFPQPGTGGDIPSRSDYGMSRDEFENHMPVEFWREVVDRINEEMPNTLLLAEAFWLMEGYFVRTLGMHRVYNSAFMHMFMKEDNAKYHDVIRNTIEFDPEILKRYVNFMSNPDEETAANQFGKGDKYFGVCIMMVTMPGLPMFAHGQIEGLTEKYGMEYYKAYYDEHIDDNFVRRHEEEIFPVIKMRHLFSEVNNFQFYDFLDNSGSVNYNVFALSNMYGEERAIVIFNNSYSETTGGIRYSYQKAVKVPGREEKELRSVTLADSLNIRYDYDYYYAFKESRTGKQYLRTGRELHNEGLQLYIGGYQYCVFYDFLELRDQTGELDRLHRKLQGKGVSSIESAMMEMHLEPLHYVIMDLFSREHFKELMKMCTACRDDKKKTEPVTKQYLSTYIKSKIATVISEVRNARGIELSETKIAGDIEHDFYVLQHLHSHLLNMAEKEKTTKSPGIKDLIVFFDEQKKDRYINLILIYVIIKRIVTTVWEVERDKNAAEVYDALMLGKPLWQSLIRLGENYATVKQEFDLIKILASNESIFKRFRLLRTSESREEGVPLFAKNLSGMPRVVTLLEKPEVQEFIQYNEANGIYYYNKESFEALLKWNFTLELMKITELFLKSQKDNGEDEKAYEKVFRSKRFTGAFNDMKAYVTKLLELSDKALYRFYDLRREIIEYNEMQLRKLEESGKSKADSEAVKNAPVKTESKKPEKKKTTEKKTTRTTTKKPKKK